MSHFTITVALPAEVKADKDALREALTETLAPFDENLEVPRYVEYTREQLIQKGRDQIEKYRVGLYAQYLADPSGYITTCSNTAHIKYISSEFQLKLSWTDEQVYADQTRWYEPQDIGAAGEVYSEYNPKSRWDWWCVGGRWAGTWRFKSPVDYDYLRSEESAFGMREDAAKALATDCGRVGDIASETFDSAWGYINLEGAWVEKGKMGWWGMSTADESDNGEARWKKQYLDWIASLPKDAWAINVDVHI